MFELTWLREENKKVFRTGPNKRKTVIVNRPLHYQDVDGSWRDVELTPDFTNKGVLFNRLPERVKFPLSSDEPLMIEDRDSDAWVKVRLDPFTMKQGPQTQDGWFFERSARYPDVAPNTCLDYWLEEDGRLNAELKFYSLDDVPPFVKLEIRHQDVEITEHSDEIHFLHKDTGERLWYMTGPKFVDAEGHEWPVPLNVRKKDTGLLVLDIEVPIQWMRYGVQDEYEVQFPVTLDPVFESETYAVYNGDTITHTTSTDITIEWAQCRWQGWNSTSSSTTFSTNQSNISSIAIPLPNGSRQRTTTVPSVPSGYSFSRHRIYGLVTYSGDPYDALGITCWIHNVTGSATSTTNNNSSSNASTSRNYYSNYVGYTSYHEGAVNGGDPDGSCVLSSSSYINTRGSKTTITTHNTENPSVTVQESNHTVSGPSSVSGGSWTSWYNLQMVEGTNTFNHSISGSERAYWEFEYEWEHNRPDPKGYVKVEGHWLPLAEIGDELLDYPAFVRVQTEKGILCADLVDLDHMSESNVRLETPEGILSWCSGEGET